MRRCLELAARGRGKVGNGALVGAVLVRRGKIVAEGWHEGWGMAHAERMLIQNLCEKNERALKSEEKPVQKIDAEDVLYVNLEPCCHHGKTPPCTDIIIESGVGTVVYGMHDPDPRVSVEGIARLSAAGVRVIGPVLETECMRLNRGFISARTKKRPWITLKKALMPDGSIANPDGSPRKITTDDQDHWAHEFLRARHDAILVGVGTIIRDDPQLNIRFVRNNPPLLRLILDPKLRIPLSAKVVNPPLATGTIVICAKGRPRDEQVFELQRRGVRLMHVGVENGHFNWQALWNVLAAPDGDFHGLTSILVEGGNRTWCLFREGGIVDEEIFLTSRTRINAKI